MKTRSFMCIHEPTIYCWTLLLILFYWLGTLFLRVTNKDVIYDHISNHINSISILLFFLFKLFIDIHAQFYLKLFCVIWYDWSLNHWCRLFLDIFLFVIFLVVILIKIAITWVLHHSHPKYHVFHTSLTHN